MLRRVDGSAPAAPVSAVSIAHRKPARLRLKHYRKHWRVGDGGIGSQRGNCFCGQRVRSRMNRLPLAAQHASAGVHFLVIWGAGSVPELYDDVHHWSGGGIQVGCYFRITACKRNS